MSTCSRTTRCRKTCSALFDLKNLAEGRLTRVTTGKLPTAEIAFLDEVFRGGGHILNTLLTIINEKRYDSGGGSVHVPLLGLVAAANYAKLDMELEAFFDRFPIRVWVRSVFEQERRSYTARIPAGVSSRLVRFEVQNEISRLLGAWAAPENSAKELDTARLSCTNDFRFRANLPALQDAGDARGLEAVPGIRGDVPDGARTCEPL